MNAKRCISTVVLAAAIVVFGYGCATGRKAYEPTQHAELSGTWVNPDYDRISLPAKVIYKNDGMFECYATLSDPVADWTCSSEVIDMWTDDEGNTWYKCVFQSYGGGSSTYYALDRVSNGGKTWERAFSNIEYPKLIDPDDVMAMYRIYYRQ